ncbi:carbohydrate ABC transporter permease [Paenibacillus thermotolerans]|uniref:carbohydrate ABC transporter permease n=1 Tax=Paenibacillus thermotolerans TaxID=3027807 RepID=UPI0023674DCA|nr:MULTISPECIES: carbohydrate ABC transporter permease [unclassified Paenibacillus]
MTRAAPSKSIGQLAISIILIAAGFLMIFPFLWIFSTSLRPAMESFKLPPALFPTRYDWKNYAYVFEAVPFFHFFLNSLKIALFITAGQLVTCATAAYAFARLQFPGRTALFLLLLSGLMIPSQVTIIPLFITIKNLGWMDTHASLIVPALVNPFGIFLLRQYMMTIPKELEEAARVDGASRFRIFWNIMMPIAAPAAAVVAVFTFIGSWNNFFGPLLFLNTYEKMTLPLGLTILQGYMGNGNPSAILAGVMMSIVPVLLFYIFSQKYLIEGTTLGSIKG